MTVFSFFDGKIRYLAIGDAFDFDNRIKGVTVDDIWIIESVVVDRSEVLYSADGSDLR